MCFAAFSLLQCAQCNTQVAVQNFNRNPYWKEKSRFKAVNSKVREGAMCAISISLTFLFHLLLTTQRRALEGTKWQKNGRISDAEIFAPVPDTATTLHKFVSTTWFDAFSQILSFYETCILTCFPNCCAVQHTFRIATKIYEAFISPHSNMVWQ